MNQLFSGYILQSVHDIILKSEMPDFYYNLAKQLSYFYCQNPILNNTDNEREHPIFTVIDNQLSRGLPTLSSVFIEQQFEKIFGLTEEKIDNIGGINYNFINTKEAKPFLRSFVIAEPRQQELNSETTYQTWEDHGGSEYEKVFFEKIINKFAKYSNQLLQLQRTINSVTDGKEGKQDIFKHQSCDFVIQFPEFNNYKQGIVIEIDGKQHDIDPQLSIDKLRDHFANENNFETLRIKTSEINNVPEDKIKKLTNFLEHPYFRLFEKNINNPIFSSDLGLDYMQFFLSPFGIARIQKALIKALKTGLIDINKQKISIAIIERDLPCGKIAIEDLLLQIKHLSILQNGQELKIPEFEIQIYNTKEFAKAKLNLTNNCTLFSDNINFKAFDLVIDISILNHETFLNRPKNSLARQTIIIKSLHHTSEKRKFNFYPSIKYLNTPENRDSENINHLNFFLQSFFRKQTFREGQVEILSKALQKKNPIALLPTGAGKSLTYQIASLLQAGLIIVVDPIKSLMKDQNENLKNALIDATTYINSTLSAKEKEKNIRDYTNGEYLFAFISPERFVIENFRRQISQLKNYRKNFAFCVIDEAHCVSEWGHDFRTAYLKLGDNSRQYCFSGHNDENIPTLGLTGTASFDVLSDVQREVGLQNESDIVRPEKLERTELKFKIKNVEAHHFGANNFWEIQNSVLEATKQGLLNILNNDLISEKHLKEYNANSFSDFIKYQGSNSNCGLIFCPHSTDKIASGVKHIAQFLKMQFPDVAHLIGEYYGSGDSNDLDKVQEDFKNNKITLLVATKAFGMGIDKPNIRFTIHITHPISIEGFYQEAGRAGRDRKNAVCYILHSNNLLLPNGKTVARNIQDTFLFNAFKGPDYDKNSTFELLEKVTFPYSTNKKQLQEYINQQFGREIRVGKPFPAHAPSMVYINGAEFGQTYGRINFSPLSASTNGFKGFESILTLQDALEVLNEMVNYIINNNPNGLPLANWLQLENETPELNGIEYFIKNIPPSKTDTLTIGLENNGIQTTVDYLNQFYKSPFEYGMVKNATNYCQSSDDFVKNLRNEYHRTYHKWIDFDLQQIDDLKFYFTTIRLDQDTFKIIYRLSILGIVKDYTIQYPSFATLICQNLSNEEIYSNLHTHFLRYYPEKYVIKIMQKARNGNQSAIRNCINTLIDFTYENIFDKRKKALDNISDAIEKAIQETINTDENRGNELFKANVNDYFDSQFVEEIRALTDMGSLTDFSIFEYFAEKAENNDQLRQLENSARRSLEAYNRNPVISLLQYYASTLISQSDNSKLLNITKKLYVDQNNFSYQEFDEILKKVTLFISEKSEQALIYHKKNIKAVLILQAKQEIENINNKILENYV